MRITALKWKYLYTTYYGIEEYKTYTFNCQDTDDYATMVEVWHTGICIDRGYSLNSLKVASKEEFYKLINEGWNLERLNM